MQRKVIFIFILLFIFLGLLLFFFYPLHTGEKITDFSYIRQAGPYPGKGYAPFASAYPWGEQLADPRIRSQITLAYAGIKWQDIEPEQGHYDFEMLEQVYHLDTLKREHYRIVLRIIADQPSGDGDMAIPHWLYEAIEEQGTWYESGENSGFSPNYDHPAMIKAHKEMVRAIADYYGEDFIAYIEMGTVGHYGEWHTSAGGEMPSEESMEVYTEHYRRAFPNTRLLFRRPFQASLAFGAGYYNDMLGTQESTDLWLDWIQKGDPFTQSAPIPEFWNRGPVGGEFSYGDPYSPLDQDHLEETLRQIRESHMSFIGPCVPLLPQDEEQFQNAQKVLQMLGYDVFLRQVSCPGILTHGNNQICLSFENRGVAPMFLDFEVDIYLVDALGNIVSFVTDRPDLSRIASGSREDYCFNLPIHDKIESGAYQIYLGFRDPWTGKPFPLSNETGEKDKMLTFSVSYVPRYSLYNYVKNRIPLFSEP